MMANNDKEKMQEVKPYNRDKVGENLEGILIRAFGNSVSLDIIDKVENELLELFEEYIEF